MSKQNKFYKVHQLMDGVYVLCNSFVNMTLVVGEKRALLFDTGWGFADFTDVVKEITDLPLDVVISHGHFDHAGGNCFVKGPVYMHQADLEVEKRYFSSLFLANAFHAVSSVQKIVFWIPCIPKTLKKEEYAARGYDGYIPVEEGRVFDLGGTTLEVVELPGHTPGSIGLLCREKRLMLVSDAINETVYLHLPESQKLSTYIATVKKALQIDFDYFINGHVPKLYPKNRMEVYLDLAENLDYPNGKPVKPDYLRNDGETRNCYRKGIRSRRGQPYLRISNDKL